MEIIFKVGNKEKSREQPRITVTTVKDRVTSYCHPVRSGDAAARYVVKDLSDSSKKEVPPAGFKGKLFSYSRQFFAKPLAVLAREVVEAWRTQARLKKGYGAGSPHPGVSDQLPVPGVPQSGAGYTSGAYGESR